MFRLSKHSSAMNAMTYFEEILSPRQKLLNLNDAD